MGEIKSAAEIAREKLEKIGEATEEERLKWKYVPDGEKLAARYLKENVNLVTALDKYEEKARKYVSGGVTNILMRNINLPRNDAARKTNKKAMEGLNVNPDDTIVIENAPYGIKSAKEAGAFCIAITTSLPREYVKDADIVCDSLEKIRELIIGGNL